LTITCLGENPGGIFSGFALVGRPGVRGILG
jgi:hypothetical protein